MDEAGSTGPLDLRGTMMNWLVIGITAVAFLGDSVCFAGTAGAEMAGVYRQRADEVTRQILASYWKPGARIFSEQPNGDPAAVWSGGIMFSALVGAARLEPKTYTPLLDAYFHGLETYWDPHAPIPGYEPFPTQGGHDKYYDDNAWLVISFVEAYEVTGSAAYLRRAKQTLKFVISGHDDLRGGGIWWHEKHKDGTKNTCVTAPAAVGCLRVHKHASKRDQTRLIEFAQALAEWTTATLRRPDGLYADRIEVESGKIHEYPLTYNTALMIRAYLGLHHATGEQAFLDEAVYLGEAAQAFVQDDTHAYRDDFKWSHLMLEADLALYRATDDPRYFQRAKATADYYYAAWTNKRPEELIELGSIARALWLMAELEADPQGPLREDGRRGER